MRIRIASKPFIFLLAICLTALVYAAPARSDYARGREAYLMKDYVKAMQQFMIGDDQGSLYMVGYMYDHGEGVPQDGKLAAEWYAKSAETGSVKAMYRLGVMYANGYGVEKDEKEAIKWYKKAAFKGFVPAKDALNRLEKSSK